MRCSPSRRCTRRPPGVGVDQGPFLNAVLIADDPACDEQAWLRRAQEFERAARPGSRRALGPAHPRRRPDRLLSSDPTAEVISRENNLTLPHPLAHLRAFVMIPWLDVDPDAQLTVAEGPRPVAAAAGRAGRRPTGRVCRLTLGLALDT